MDDDSHKNDKKIKKNKKKIKKEEGYDKQIKKAKELIDKRLVNDGLAEDKKKFDQKQKKVINKDNKKGTKEADKW